MKSLLVTLIIICSFLSASAQTYISSDFYNNDTLRKSKSPYILNVDVVIFQNVEVFIEPGTTLMFNGKSITVRGSIIAEGTATDSITFSTNDTLKGTSIIIQENDKPTTYQLYMKHCIVENHKNFFTVDKQKYWRRGAFHFYNCNFRNNDVLFSSLSPSLDNTHFYNCTFYNNNVGINFTSSANTNFIIKKCSFINNDRGVAGGGVSGNNYSAAGGVIDSCYFTGHRTYAVMYKNIKNSVIYNNKVGIRGRADNNTVAENNEIIYNEIGAELEWSDNFATGNDFFKGNVICHNSEWNIKNVSTNDGNVFHTCWCSTDSLQIRKTISDGYVDNQYGRLFINSYSDTCSASLPAPDTTNNNTSIPQATNIQTQTRLYPNPVTNTATLEFSYEVGNSYLVTIKDITGKTIRTVDNIISGKIALNVTELQAGMYFVTLSTQQGILDVQKMIIE